MLHRWIVSLCLTLLFALTQIGAVTHVISHFNATSQQNQQDQHTPSEQCAQCLAYAQSAAGTLSHHAIFTVSATTFHFSAQTFPQPEIACAGSYSARAPPTHLL